MYKVLVSDPISEKGLAKLREAGDVEVDVRTGLSPQELAAIIGEYDALIVRSQTKVTAELINAGRRLKVIGRAGVGVDNIDVAAATSRGIIVLNAPEGNTISAAEHTWAMLLALARQIPDACASLKAGQWDRKRFLGVELAGKVLGVIGFGRIGSEVARRAQGFRMHVLAYDPFLSLERAEAMGVEMVELEELFRRSDFITVHTPMTPETRHLIGERQLAMMKDGVRIVNVARGGIVDEAALLAALESGKVAGAALDVFEEEPPPASSPLIRHPRVVVTPHLGASTVEAQENVAVDVAEELIKALRGEAFKNAVNLPSLRPEMLAKLRPYLDLGERLGLFLSQLLSGRLHAVEIAYAGALTELEVTPVTTAILKGLLTPVLGDEVNVVNAPWLAKERGIRVAETKVANGEDYRNLISVQAATDREKVQVRGAIFGKNEPRLVEVDGYDVDVSPEGYFLVTRHLDKPGMIGRVGTILGEAGVNIAAMQVGRREMGGRAIMLLAVDSAIPAEVLERIARVEGIQEARLVHVATGRQR